LILRYGDIGKITKIPVDIISS